jgi:hypothetical protein
VRELVTIVSAAPTWMVKFFVAVVPAESDRRSENWKVPEAVSVPLTWPPFRLNPAGKLPPETVHV